MYHNQDFGAEIPCLGYDRQSSAFMLVGKCDGASWAYGNRHFSVHVKHMVFALCENR